VKNNIFFGNTASASGYHSYNLSFMDYLNSCIQFVFSYTSAKKYSIQAEWLRQSGHAPSELAETPLWHFTPRPASIQRIALYIALRLLFHCLFAFCRSPILNDHSGVVANCENMSEWVLLVRACIRIAMRWVTL
jgi:hypothetical protein